MASSLLGTNVTHRAAPLNALLAGQRPIPPCRSYTCSLSASTTPIDMRPLHPAAAPIPAGTWGADLPVRAFTLPAPRSLASLVAKADGTILRAALCDDHAEPAPLNVHRERVHASPSATYVPSSPAPFAAVWHLVLAPATPPRSPVKLWLVTKTTFAHKPVTHIRESHAELQAPQCAGSASGRIQRPSHSICPKGQMLSTGALHAYVDTAPVTNLVPPAGHAGSAPGANAIAVTEVPAVPLGPGAPLHA